MIVKHSDMTSCKFCNRGARQFFDRHGLDWQTFVKDGIPAEQLEVIDDEMSRQVLARARKREEGNV